ncbi:MAG: M20/M25/M40 family metallo-hydrolase, partial [Deltaproteobacteria bacterium]|nr:M20/M25/M40 family metallo-hydrolase [Deltaproteobacteria bacterium]
GGAARSGSPDLAIVGLALAVLTACGPGEPGHGVDVDRTLAHVASLTAIGPRPGDSAKAREAAAYIETSIADAGGTPERYPVGAVDLPPITVMGVTYRSARRSESTDPNIVVRFGPPGRALVIMAHYDTVHGSPGAVDNAAAVGVLVELARILARDPPPYGVMLAFTANEEVGLVGAEALAARIGDDVAFAIALDLVGGSGDLVLNGASEMIGAEEMRWLASAADRAGSTIRTPLAHRVVSRWWPQAERSDHGPFTRRGIRAIHFYNRGQDGEWIDLAYHSPRDVMERVDRSSVDELGRILHALARVAPPAPGGDGFWIPVLRNRVLPRWALLAIELVLALVALGSLIASRSARARGGLGLLAGTACFALAAGATYLTEQLARGDHPGPWIHAPLAAAIAELLVFAGALGLITLALRRMRAWNGELRYLVVAASIPLAVGVALLVIGAAELAWIWLLPAVVIALAPRLAVARWLSPLVAALPALLVLSPNQLREAAWNGFLPATTSLALLLAMFILPVAAVVAYLARRRGATGPLGSFVLPVGCLLSVIAGVVLVSRAHPRCTAPDFNQFHLACEATPGVR